MAGKGSGESITIEKANGETVTLEKRADGQLSVKTSKDPTCIRVYSAEVFCWHLGIWILFLIAVELLLADSDRICTDGAYMDSIADTSYSREHEHGNCSKTALFE